ncbi:MAG TPA: hypothetical protein VK163_14540 [Opitutaceae bacterium]|nr:hypothetical protein [Opitutaceae bacterium]
MGSSSDQAPRAAGVSQFFRSPEGRRYARIAGWSLVAVAVVWYLALMASRMGVCAAGSDSSGYVNNARLLREGRLFADQRQLEGVNPQDLPWFTYVPLGFEPLHSVRPFNPADANKMVPTYPLGLSALFVAASVGSSLEAGMPVAMWVMLAASLFLTYRLARQCGLSPGWATAGMAMLAASPVFIGMSLQAMSDVPALCWTTLALVLALDSRERRWLAGLSGLAVAVAVFIRPSNVLVVLPLLWVFRFDWRRWLWLGLCGLPGAVVWMLTNKALFGRYIATGYGDVGQLFGWHNVLPVLRNYALSFPRVLPLCFLAVLGLGREARAESRAALAVAVTWVVLPLAFYAFYFHTQEAWWYLRFVLPAFPALIALALRGLRRVHGWISGGLAAGLRPVLARAAVAVVFAAGFFVQARAARSWDALEFGRGEKDYPKLAQLLERHAPANAVVFCMQTSGALYFAGPQILVRWDALEREQASRLYAAATRAGRPVYAAFFPFEVHDGCFKKLPGRWTQVANVRDKTIWRLDDAAGSMPETIELPSP